MRNVLSSLVLLGVLVCFSGEAFAEGEEVVPTRVTGTPTGERVTPPTHAAQPRPAAPHQSDWRRWRKRRGERVSVPELGFANGAEALALLLGGTLLVVDRRRRVQIA